MPRKRRSPKRRAALPQGLAQISLCERARWSSSGPLLTTDVVELSEDAPYHVWPSLDAWAARIGEDAQRKRATINVTVPRAARTWPPVT